MSTSSRATRGAARHAMPIALAVAIAIAALDVVSAAANAAACKNEAIRDAQKTTYLPECRAYELVSPPGNDAEYGIGGGAPQLYGSVTADTLASVSGESLSYFSFYPDAEDQSSGKVFVSTRTETGWTTANAVPPQSTSSGEFPECPGASVYFSANLTQSVLTDGGRPYRKSGVALRTRACERDEPALAASEPEDGFANLFMHQSGGGYTVLNPLPAGGTPENAVLQDVSANFEHVVFSEAAKLVEGAPEKSIDLYESSPEGLRLVSYLPTGTAVEGSLADGMPSAIVHETGGVPVDEHPVFEEADPSASPITHAVSSEGEYVYFTALGSGGTGDLYLREHATRAPTATGGCSASEPNAACTVQVDTSQGGTGPSGGGPSGGGQFLYASANGQRAFFLDESRLTREATAAAGRPDLYEYDLEAPEGQRLKDLTVDASEPADVLGLAGGSEDGSYLYFVADGALPSSGANSQGQEAQPGAPNLYVQHAGATRFIATLSAATDSHAWAAGTSALHFLTSATSPSGAFLAFDSQRPLTGYDNAPAKEANCGGGATACTEVFLYSAGEGKLSCASCGPAGAAPIGESQLLGPDGPAYTVNEPLYRRRELLEGGTLFFESANRLAPAAKNDYMKVYMYRSGEAQLISSGSAEAYAVFDEASPDGRNVFFVSPQKLVPADTGETPSIYDARVEGGFEEREPPGECAGEPCLGPASPPLAATPPGSAAFQGPGNLAPQLEAKGPSKKLSRHQKLEAALKKCAKRRQGRGRKLCRQRARRRYGPPHAHKARTRAKRRGGGKGRSRHRRGSAKRGARR
ncbi:MAG: hypothetical protein ACYCSI_13675 [Solirubrobacteraceae bacterium]